VNDSRFSTLRVLNKNLPAQEIQSLKDKFEKLYTKVTQIEETSNFEDQKSTIEREKAKVEILREKI
jgi:hypothetical protein